MAANDQRPEFSGKSPGRQELHCVLERDTLPLTVYLYFVFFSSKS